MDMACVPGADGGQERGQIPGTDGSTPPYVSWELNIYMSSGRAEVP